MEKKKRKKKLSVSESDNLIEIDNIIVLYSW